MSAELERDLELARKRRENVSGKASQGAENAYGQAFQALVKSGARTQLKLKYRRPKG